ncbi:MAG TPA: ABC transporter ATP-binding protein [Mycobacteriales bacterium]|nr:ABC transporter ATP-binding protein [Mycobacteriales bacterium]
MGGEVVHALRGVDLTICQGESVAVIGPSGSGKSTLLHLIGLLDRPTGGTYRLGGTDTSRLSDDQRARLRNRAIGFVFQSFNLVAAESALDNVAAPLVYAGVRRAERLNRGREALDRVGLADRARHRPSQLSGGQRQRVAIARALVTRPPLLLADEPTGNLDSTSGADVLGLLDQLRASGLTVVTITHDADIAAHADRVVRIADGQVVSEAWDVVGVGLDPSVGLSVGPTGTGDCEGAR